MCGALWAQVAQLINRTYMQLSVHLSQKIKFHACMLKVQLLTVG